MGASLQCAAFPLVVPMLGLHSDRRSVTMKLIQQVCGTMRKITHSSVEVPSCIPELHNKLVPIGGRLAGVGWGVDELLKGWAFRIL
jgi:hypothetical protein